MAFAFGLFWLGYFTEVYPIFFVSSVAFLIIAIGLFTGGLTFKTGEIITNQNVCNSTLEDVCSNETIYYNLTKVVEYQYSEPIKLSKFLGTLFLMMSFFSIGCAIIYATPKKEREY